MDYVKDISLGDDLDLVIKNGDFFISESDQEHILILLKTTMGSFREFPFIGMGIDFYEAGSYTPQQIKRDIRFQLMSDNYKVDKINITPDYTFSIAATRVR